MLDRRSFLAGGLAVGLAAPNILRAQRVQKVIVVGAGPAGITTAYHLTKAGVDVTVLEASSRWGGRVKRLEGYGDLPLDLGAEWIHAEAEVFGKITGDGPDDLGIETLVYNPKSYQFWHEGQLKNFDTSAQEYEDLKFLDTTWYGFFERFMVPTVADKIVLNAPVAEVSVSGQQVQVLLDDGKTLEADRVVVAVPLSVLQGGGIRFGNGLASENMNHLGDFIFGTGHKVFLGFEEKFYADVQAFGPPRPNLGQDWNLNLYYDAAFGKPTEQNLLGLIRVSEQPIKRGRLEDRALMRAVIAELEDIYGDVVPRTLQWAHVQNWSQEEYIRGSYPMSNTSSLEIEEVLSPLDGRVYFAGDMLGAEALSSVRGAAFSGIRAVDQILKG